MHCTGAQRSLGALPKQVWLKTLYIFKATDFSPSATNVAVLVLVLVVGNPKAFSFHNRSSPNFAYT